MSETTYTTFTNTRKNYPADSAVLAILNERIARANRLLRKNGHPEITVEFGPIRQIVDPNFGRASDVFDFVTINGVNIVADGWSAIASLDHTYGELPIISKFPPARDTELPEQYAAATGNCDHCGRNARRSLTIVLRHDDGRWIQVGRQCVKDFLNVSFTHIASCWVSEDIFDDEDQWESCPPTYHTVEGFLRAAEIAYRMSGFVPSSSVESEPTRELAKRIVAGRCPEWKNEVRCGFDEIAATAKTMLEWAQSDQCTWDALKPAVLADRAGDRTYGILASVPHVWRKACERKAQNDAKRAESNHVGNVGDRITVTGVVTTARVIDTDYGASLRISITTEEGNIITTFGSGRTLWDAEIGDRVEMIGTVKKHSDDQFGRQTHLTRVRLSVLEAAES